MDIVRRNTDYALRAMVNLARNYDKGPQSNRIIAEQENVPYQLLCKLMQKLNSAGLVTSFMGPKGGFGLSRQPSKISLLEIIESIQAPIRLNRCLLAGDICPRQKHCPVKEKLLDLQEYIGGYFSDITLDELIAGSSKKDRKKLKRGKK
ncbi:MAG: Rrf2 family transcriptional regulator [Sedimentisphaerales bacterium]|nr:Rrf2 family transcriptional regulator [Sedimentisphaerales bacterium]